jgi:hypothetical protein
LYQSIGLNAVYASRLMLPPGWLNRRLIAVALARTMQLNRPDGFRRASFLPGMGVSSGAGAI